MSVLVNKKTEMIYRKKAMVSNELKLLLAAFKFEIIWT